MSIVAQPRITNSNTTYKVKVTLSSYLLAQDKNFQPKTFSKCNNLNMAIIFCFLNVYEFISTFQNLIFLLHFTYLLVIKSHIILPGLKSYLYVYGKKFLQCYFWVIFYRSFKHHANLWLSKNCNFYRSSYFGEKSSFCNFWSIYCVY